jgi:hypothetical protein
MTYSLSWRANTQQYACGLEKQVFLVKSHSLHAERVVSLCAGKVHREEQMSRKRRKQTEQNGRETWKKLKEK